MLTRDEVAELDRLMRENSDRGGEPHHPALRERALHDIRCQLREAVREIRRAEEERGGSLGKHAAGRAFNRLLVVAAVSWFQTTGQDQKPYEDDDERWPVNDYGRFVATAVAPFQRALDDATHRGLIARPGEWSSVRQRLLRMKLRGHDLL